MDSIENRSTQHWKLYNNSYTEMRSEARDKYISLVLERVRVGLTIDIPQGGDEKNVMSFNLGNTREMSITWIYRGQW